MVTFGPLALLFYVIALVPAMLLHELAHGWTARRLGDLTPKVAGRLTFSLRAHVDPIGTIIVPGLLLLPVLFGRPSIAFGYAKAMPFDPQNLRKPRRDTVLVALSGMATNVALGVIGGLVFRVLGSPGGLVSEFLVIWIFTNFLMAFFHLFPVPPLDGSKILPLYLPFRARNFYVSLEPYGGLFILLLVFIIRTPLFGLATEAAQGFLELVAG